MTGAADLPTIPIVQRTMSSISASPSLRSGSTVIDDLDPAVLRLLHAIAGWNQQVPLALGDDPDLAGGNTVLLQLGRDRFRPAPAEPHIIGVRAHRVGVACHRQLRDLRRSGVVGCLIDNRLRLWGQVGFVEIEEDKIAPRGRGRRGCDSWRRRVGGRLSGFFARTAEAIFDRETEHAWFAISKTVKSEHTIYRDTPGRVGMIQGVGHKKRDIDWSLEDIRPIDAQVENIIGRQGCDLRVQPSVIWLLTGPRICRSDVEGAKRRVQWNMVATRNSPLYSRIAEWRKCAGRNA